MKMLIISICIIVVLAVSAFGYNFYLERTGEHLILHVDEVVESALGDDVASASSKSNELYDDVVRRQKTLGTLINHSEINQIVLSASRLKSYAHLNEENDFYTEAEELKLLLKNMIEKERFNIKNFF